MSIPLRLRRWLRQRLVGLARPCLIHLDRDCRVLSVAGDTEHYGLGDLMPGAEAVDYLPMLVGLDLAALRRENPAREFWPMMELSAGRYADVLLDADDDEVRILLTDVGEEHARRFAPQQQANERALLMRQLRVALGDLESARSQLADRNRELQTLDSAKGRFIAGLSHELRTPLSAVLGHADLLRERLDGGANDTTEAQGPGCDATADSVNAIRSAAEHLLSLVNNLLDHASLETGQLVMYPAPMDPARLCDDMRGMFESEASRRGMTFRVRRQGLPARITTDATRLRQVIINLIGNALKYAGAGFVELLMEWREGRLFIAVADTGPGVPAAQRRRILQPFERAAPADGERTERSIGLGLAISSALVRLLGGELGIGDRDGGGAVFSFSIDAPVPAGMRSVGVVQTATRVLLVEDAAELRALYKTLLEGVGFSVQAAGDAEAALGAFDHQQPEAIVIDLHLGDEDGTALVRRFRASGFRGRILVWSASDLRDDRERVLAAGADGYLVKPVPIAELREALQQSS
jgi:signal transduction histidine kinase